MHKKDDKDSQRRRWVEANISSLMQQRTAIDRKVAEFKAFLAFLDLSDTVIGNGHASDQGGASDSLPAIIESILREARRPMTTPEVAEAVVKRGWKPDGKNSVKARVGIELPRQAKIGRRHIVKVDVGTYAYAFTSGGES
jgi:hypothetical protein